MTAIQWLKHNMQNKLTSELGPSFKELFEQAEEIEKNQIIEAVSYGNSYYKNYEAAEVTGENYYQETYSK